MDDRVLEQLNQAINTILNPASTSEQRTEAHSICEACKQHNHSHLIGYTFASNPTYEPHVKHFGLQLMHSFIQSKWNKLDQTTQIQIKNNAISLFQNCQITESGYVKDGIAHVLVEIAKHVWPQNWPSMIGDLISFSNKGPVQTELTELILLRLAEDVAILQNISVGHRSKDIRQGLSLSMSEIMQFLLNNLQNNYAKFMVLHNAGNYTSEYHTYLHIVNSTLLCLQGFLEWANIDQVFMQDGILLQMLCEMINVEPIQLNAADCLRLIVARKGKVDERKFVLHLTEANYVKIIVNSIKPFSSDTDTARKHYKFLKSLGQIFAGLASQIVAHWVEKESDIGQKDCLVSLQNKSTFLNVLLEFYAHDSKVISNTVANCWLQMFRHKLMAMDPILQTYVPKLLPILQQYVKKHRQSPSSLKAIEQEDFLDDEKLKIIYKSSRQTAIEVVRFCTKAVPLEVLKYVLNWLQTLLQTPIDNGYDPETGMKLEKPTVKSPVYVEWEALFVAMDMAFGVLLDSLKTREELNQFPASLTEDLCIQILTFPSHDPLIWIALIHAAASFFHLFDAMPRNIAVIVQFLTVIMDIFRKTATEEKTTAIASLRRQASTLLIRLCKHYSPLVNITSEFKPLVLDLVNADNVLSTTEKITMYECLVLVSREWKNFQQQSQLIGEIMSLDQDMWLPKDADILQDPAKFAKAIGLCDSGESQEETDRSIKVRSCITYCVTIIAGMINRSSVPTEDEDKKAGGFINQNGETTNPCAAHVAPVFDYIISFLDMMHGVWTSYTMCYVNKNMLPALSMRHSERLGLLVNGPEQYNNVAPSDDDAPKEKKPWEHIQVFLALNLEQIYQVLGKAGGCLGSQFYSNPNLVPLVLTKMFKNLQTLPELRLKSFIRQFLYYFFNQCPVSLHQTVACPILHQYCVFMISRLKANWTEYAAKEKIRLRVFEDEFRETESGDEKEEDEIVKEQVLRLVTREHLELVVNLCVEKKPSAAKRKLDRAAAIENQQNGHRSNGSSPTNTGNAIKMEAPSDSNALLTALGRSVMDSEGAETLLTTGLVALSFYDTTTVNKAIQILWPVLKHTFECLPFLSDDASQFIFESILMGLQRHGQHEGCQAQLLALGLLVWMKLRPGHVNIKQILMQVPSTDKYQLEEFDTNYTKYNEKRKKMCFKKLTSGIIEHHVGQRFKNEQSMSVLPRIFRTQQRFKNKPLSELEPHSLGLEIFFQPEPR